MCGAQLILTLRRCSLPTRRCHFGPPFVIGKGVGKAENNRSVPVGTSDALEAPFWSEHDHPLLRMGGTPVSCDDE